MNAADLIKEFYKAFQNLDEFTMTGYYADDVLFHDPAFGQLKGNHAKNMWKMLIQSQKGKDFKVQLNAVKESDKGVVAEWQADYIFSRTGRRVHNVITAHFEIENNLIVKHRDDFNLYKWSKQALGLSGYLLGWTPFFRQKLQLQTNRLLQQYEQKQS